MVFASVFMLACLDVVAQKAAPNPMDLVSYRSIGPYRGGRSCAVAGVPGKPNLMYFGSTGGGVWKTLDGGGSWSNISDGFFGGSIGAIAIADSDPNVIYVGGGEKTVRGNVSYGYGVWKSVDAGKTWTNIGLKDSKHVGKIRIHPTNPDIVYVAVMGDLFKSSQERGVYKSIDGGKSWKRVLFANADAGAVDLVIDPTNHRFLYATTWRVRRTPYDLSSGGDGSALWKSTDEGETWTNISDAKGLPKGTWGIAGVAVSPMNGERIWALIENEAGGVYRSDDGGKTWTKVNEDRALRQRAWYYTRIVADTKDENTVYVMNVSYHKSTDGGRTFKSNDAPHGDHHDLWIAPEDSQRMIIADDGGAQVSFDGGENWTTYHNQPTAQFYRIATDNHFPYRIYAAQQDNSTIRIASRTMGSSIGEDDWEETAGGESAHIAVDPLNDDIVYGGSYGGFLTRNNHKTGSVRAVNVWPDNPMGYGAEGMKYRFQWNFPIFFSKHNKKKLFAASQNLHVSVDEGETWKIISPDLSRNEAEKLVSSGGPITKDNTGVEYYATIFAAGESPLKEGVIWAGTDDGRLHVTTDNGATWKETTDSKLMPKYIMWNSVEPSSFDVGTCYVAGTSYKSGDYTPYLYKTTDYGKTWKLITMGIEKDHFTRVVREDPKVKGLLYAGTETGMYISYNDGEKWEKFQLNLPIVPITDLAIKNNNLIVATQGRSLWIIDDLSLIHQSIKSSFKIEDKLYKPQDSYRYPGSQRKNTVGAGMNHPGGVSINYFLKDYDEKKDTVKITLLQANGDTIRSYSTHAKEKTEKLEVKNGANAFVWGMDYPSVKSFDGMILWWSSLAGPKAVPGKYKAVVSRNGKSMSEDFNILINPVTEGSQADIQAQFDFVQKVNSKVNEAHEAIINIRSLRKDITSQTEGVKSTEIKDYGKLIDSIMSKVEKELYQTKNKSGQDPLNFPIKLNNKLAHLNSLMQMGNSDFKPTASMIAVRDELIGKIDVQLVEWNKVKKDMIPRMNEMLLAQKVQYLKVD